jgi:hypothetical protein
MRRQYDLHAKESNKRLMNIPGITADPDQIRQSMITSGSSSDFILHILITRALSS